MACYIPNLVRRFHLDDGSVGFTFLGSNGKNISPLDPEYDEYEYFHVPCGKCLGCRLDQSREWANRMAIELAENDGKGIFVTLTYNNEHLPYSFRCDDKGCRSFPSLNPRDPVLFFKRLRQRFPGVRIRYFLAGEYGSKRKRPHYHAIIFGLDLNDFPDLSLVGKNELGQFWYTSLKLASIWSCGFVQISPVTYRTCAYTSRYVTKKLGRSSSYVIATGVVPEYNVSSRRPAIGADSCERAVRSGLVEITISIEDKVDSIPIPRSIINAFRKRDSLADILEEYRLLRSDLARDSMKLRLSKYSGTFAQYCEDEKRKLMERIGYKMPERSFDGQEYDLFGGASL